MSLSSICIKRPVLATVMNIVIILLSVMAGATTVVLSQTIGSGDLDRVGQVCTVSTLIISAGGALATAILVFGGRALFGFLSVPQDVLGEALSYTIIVGAFVLVQGLYMNFAAILRRISRVRSVEQLSSRINS